MTIEQVFDGFSKLKVLVIGDLMLDSYIWGKVDRVSPEAPVPVVSNKKMESRLGGAGNVLMNLKALGTTPIACSVIGNDGAGQTMVSIFEKENIETSSLIIDPSRPTTEKLRVLAQSQQLLRIDTETEAYINDDILQKLEQNIVERIEKGVDVIIFQDYDKGVICKSLIEKIIDLANVKNIPVVVDPKKKNFLNYKGATLFKPNAKELKEGLGLSFDSSNTAEIEAVVHQLKEHLSLKGAFLTLSEKGVFIDYKAEKSHIPAHTRSISDVSGAGDTVISIAAACVALNLPAAQIAGLANLGGGLVCESLGVVPIDINRLKTEAQKLWA